jgi:hypothetical protein
MFLAQVLHESMRLTRFEEIDSGARYEGNKALGNTQPGDGVRFKGRGPIQITGRWNYTHFGKLVGLDLVRRPELAAVPRHGWRLAAAYFEDRGCNEAADRGDFRKVTSLINAGMAHLEERRRFYELLSKADVIPPRSEEQLTARTKRGRRSDPERRRQTGENRTDRAEAEDTKPRSKRGTLPEAVAEFKRVEAEKQRAWERLAERGLRQRRSLSDERAAARGEVGAILLRIEEKLETLLELERGTASSSGQESTVRATATTGPSGNGGGQAPSTDRGVDLKELTDSQIVRRIQKLEGVSGRARAALIRRYLDAHKELTHSGGARGRRQRPSDDGRTKR